MTDVVVRIVIDSSGANQNTNRIVTGLDTAENKAKAVGRALTAAFAAFGGAQAIKQIVAIDDAYARIEGRLKLVTSSTQQLQSVQNELFATAQRTGSAYEEIAELYTRVAQNTKDLGISQAELLRFTETTAQAFQVSGASAQESAGAVRQLTQALASGVLRGEEFNSVNEQGPRIMQALADSLNVARGDLRKMAEEGKLTADIVLTAMRDQAAVIGQEFSALPVTVGRAMTELQNEVKRAIAGADLSPLVVALRELSAEIAKPENVRALAELAAGITKVATAAVSAAKDLVFFKNFAALVFSQLEGADDALVKMQTLQGAIDRGVFVAGASRKLEELRASGMIESATAAQVLTAATAAASAVTGELNVELENNIQKSAEQVQGVDTAADALKKKEAAEQNAKKAAEAHAKAVESFIKSVKAQNAELEITIGLIRSGVDADEAAERARLKVGGATQELIEKTLQLKKELRELAAAADFELGFAKNIEETQKILDGTVAAVDKELQDSLNAEFGASAEYSQARADFLRGQNKETAVQFGADVEQALTQGLFDGFKNSENFVENFVGSFASALQTMFAKELAQGLTKLLEGTSFAGKLPVIGSVIAMAQMQSSLGGQFKTTNSALSGDAFGALAFNPITAPIAALDKITGGSVFGTKYKVTSQEIAVEFVDGLLDATLTTVKKRKRSLGRGTRRRESTDELTDVDSNLGEQFAAIYETVAEGADTLGLMLESFSYNVEAQLKGLKPEEVQAKLQELLSGAADALATAALPSIEEFAREGETLFATFVRLEQQTQTVRVLFDNLGASLDALAPGSLDAITLADTLSAAAGGADVLATNVSAFIKGFYDAGEQTRILGENLNRTLDEVGLSLPDTADGFRALVESLLDVDSALNVTTEAGAQAFATLTAIAGSAAQYYQQLQNTVADAAAAFNADIAGQITEASLSGQSLELYRLDEEFTKLRTEAAEAGGDLVKVEELYAIRRTAIVEKYRAQELAAQEAASASAAQQAAQEAAERKRRQQQAAEEAARAAEQAQQQAEQNLRRAWDTQSRIFEDAIGKFGELAESLRDYQRELMGDASRLSPMALYEQTRGQFTETAALAAAGDEDAIARLREVSQSFLDASEAVNASGVGYFADLEAVKAAVETAAVIAESERDVQQAQLDALRETVSALIDLTDTVEIGIDEALAAFSGRGGSSGGGQSANGTGRARATVSGDRTTSTRAAVADLTESTVTAEATITAVDVLTTIAADVVKIRDAVFVATLLQADQIDRNAQQRETLFVTPFSSRRGITRRGDEPAATSTIDPQLRDLLQQIRDAALADVRVNQAAAVQTGNELREIRRASADRGLRSRLRERTS